MKADKVFDLTPGTGAAALAALLLGIPYDGVCINGVHKKWLEELLNRALIAQLCASASGGKGIRVLQSRSTGQRFPSEVFRNSLDSSAVTALAKKV